MKEPDEAPKKGRKKKTEGAKEHKKNWRETYATVEEIKAFLADHIFLRHNVITGRVECRIPSGEVPGRQGLHRRLSQGRRDADGAAVDGP
jgi:hypothetical protein